MDKFAVIREDITPQYGERKKCASGKCGCNPRSSEIPAELTAKVAKDLVKKSAACFQKQSDDLTKLEPSGRYSDADGEYDVADLLELAHKQKSRRLPIADLLHNLEPSSHETGDELPGDPAFIARAQRADRRHPGIAVDYPDGTFLADGVHRLWKAREAGKDTFPAYVLQHEQLKDLVKPETKPNS
jgi:hypothetical protein